MKKFGMRVIALALAAALVLSTGAFAANGSQTGENADRLHALGLFQGTGSGYALDKTATRLQGLIMLIRLLGEEDQALSCQDPCPFRDVAAGNPSRYTAYAYRMGYTTGTSATTFSPGGTMNFKGYVTFLLRALGYDDRAGDFTYAACLDKAAELGMTDAASAAAIGGTAPTFYRADLVDLSLAALTVKMKGQSATLAETLVKKGVFTRAEGKAQGVMGQGAQGYTYQVRDYSTVERVTKTYTVASGKVTADVITVNTANPSVTVKTALVGNTLGATDTFANIAAASGAAVVVNGNFFEAYNDSKFPIGHVMADGEFLYGVSGLTAFGFTDSGEILVDRPGVFFFVEGGGCSWACYECNARSQNASNSVLYTPAFGQSVPFQCDGVATTVSGGVIQSSRQVSAGDSEAIPRDGYVMFFGTGFASTNYYRSPKVGTAVAMTPRLHGTSEESFPLDHVVSMISGAPRLVENGQICTTLEAGFQEARFTTSVTPRTAIGKLANGKLVIVSTGAASIQQMRELMLQLGCVEAVNLDGGASTALAYQGKIVRSPGRQLTTTLQVVVK